MSGRERSGWGKGRSARRRKEAGGGGGLSAEVFFVCVWCWGEFECMVHASSREADEPLLGESGGAR